MTRRCANWLDEFKRWSFPKGEAPESFITWSGIFTLASVIKRKVCIPKKGVLGSWEAYPNIYVAFIGPPAIRKTTAMDYADELLANLPFVKEASNSMTQQVLAKRITEIDDCSISIRIDEMATFINPSSGSMIDFLVAIYDGRRKFSTDTLMRGTEFSENPCVNFMSATTPAWIANNLSEVMVGGGFTSRLITIYESELRTRQLFYRELNYKALDDIKANLIEDLTHIGLNLSGEFSFTEEAEEFTADWYNNGLPKEQKGTDYRMAGYYGRKHVHLLKLAMLIHIAYSDELVIGLSDITTALKMLKSVEKNMSQVYQAVGKNLYTVDMDNILAFIQQRVKVSRRDLYGRFYHVASPQMLGELINGLISMEKVNMDKDGNYCYVNGKT